MLGREQEEGRTVDRVDPGGEDVDPDRRGPALRQIEPHARTDRLADPVALHGQDLLGPSGQALGRLQQLVGIAGNPEKPLLELAHDDRSRNASTTVHDLLVGEDGVAVGAPVDARAPLVREVALQHLQEQPLVPVVVGRQAGRDLTLPGVADPDPLQLPFHVGDVLERPRLRVGAVLDGGVPAGRPNASHPNRWSTLKPRIRFMRATTSPIM